MTPDDAEALALAGFLYLKQEAVNEAMAVALRSLTLFDQDADGRLRARARRSLGVRG